ncbi:hypothetical protein CIPAW_15G123700 [Carya illinoinensis]|uniref:Uncharacterized protein n=1 Tax=Carya illinoinensis TaxID=32201 RepID=A0A8T1NET9_CARIL|nr:hypothetical protein CIPAW_15G123700 [Carya illinoinensis]
MKYLRFFIFMNASELKHIMSFLGKSISMPSIWLVPCMVRQYSKALNPLYNNLVTARIIIYSSMDSQYIYALTNAFLHHHLLENSYKKNLHFYNWFHCNINDFCGQSFWLQKIRIFL